MTDLMTTRQVNAVDTTRELMDVNSLGQLIPFGGVTVTAYEDSNARAMRVEDAQGQRTSSRTLSSGSMSSEYQVVDFATVLKPVFEVLGVHTPRRNYSSSRTATVAEFFFPDGWANDTVAEWDALFWKNQIMDSLMRPSYSPVLDKPLLRPSLRVSTSLNYGEAIAIDLGLERLRCTNGLYVFFMNLMSIRFSHKNFKAENLVTFLEDINLARAGDILDNDRLKNIFAGTESTPANEDFSGSKLCKFAPVGTPNALNRHISDMEKVFELRQDADYRKSFAEDLVSDGKIKSVGDFDWKDVGSYMHPTSATLLTSFTRQAIPMQEALINQFLMLRANGSRYASHVTEGDVLNAYTNAESYVRLHNADYQLDLVKVGRDVKPTVEKIVSVYGAMSWLDN